MEEYNRHELMLMKSRNKNGVNFDTEWDLFGKEFLGNRIITEILIPDSSDR